MFFNWRRVSSPVFGAQSNAIPAPTARPSQKPAQPALGSFHNHEGLVTAMVTHISPFSTVLRRVNALG